MKFTKLAITMLCALVVFCGCAKNSDVVIKVNNTEITRGEFYGDFEKIKSVQVKNLPKEFQQDNSFTVLSMKEKFVNDTILRALVSEEFAKRNITVTPKEVNERKAKLIDKIISFVKKNNCVDMIDRSVDFPHPLGPILLMNSPLLTSKFISFKAIISPSLL